VTPNDPPQKKAPPPLADGEVLVVDDDGPTRTLVLHWLKKSGFLCRDASSGEEALSMLEAEPGRYEAMVLDVMMPGMDGFEVLRRLKKLPNVASIPVLFLTASTSEQDIVRGVEAGAADYLLKPFSGPVLVAKLRAVRDRARVEWTLRRKLSSAVHSATTDGLTGLLNRRTFDDRFAELVATASRHREPLAVAMLDIDRFKAINDELGHPAGDVALRLVADRIRRVLRLGDLAFRYGGEEFVVLLRKCDRAGGLAVYERLREELRKAPIEPEGGTSRLLTISGGLATMEAGNGFKSDDLVARADAALYAAKTGGRDRMELEK
jgi:diguanylate cyclase (GGDEF)-like protein